MGEVEAQAKLVELRENFKEAREIGGEWSSGYRELMASSDTQAIEFAKLIIQSLLILHGGAIVAIPTFWSTFPVVVQNQPVTVWGVFSIFVVGLLCAVVAAALGFHCLANRADGNNRMISVASHQAWLHIYEMRQAGGDETVAPMIELAESKFKAGTEEANVLLASFTRQRACAILLIWGSIACLILGAIAGLLLVSS